MVPSSAVRSTFSHIQTLNMQNTRQRWLTAVIMLILNDTACSSRARKCPEQKQRGRNSSRVLLYTVHQLILLSTTFKTAGHRLGPTLKKIYYNNNKSCFSSALPGIQLSVRETLPYLIFLPPNSPQSTLLSSTRKDTNPGCQLGE